MSPRLSEIIDFMEAFAPTGLAEEWDNVGLLLGDQQAEVNRGLTCLTVTPEVIEEAIEKQARVLVAHHPFPFRPLKKITRDTIIGRMVHDLIRNDIAVYSPHTAFDSTRQGINQMIADKLGLRDVGPLRSIPGWEAAAGIEPTDANVKPPEPNPAGGIYGIGRCGQLPSAATCEDLMETLINKLRLPLIKLCGNRDTPVRKVGIACGAAGQFLSEAKSLGCDLFITGETNFHTCLEAIASEVNLLLLGHYGSERFAVESLAEILAREFPGLSIEPSSAERDPIRYFFPNRTAAG